MNHVMIDLNKRGVCENVSNEVRGNILRMYKVQGGSQAFLYILWMCLDCENVSNEVRKYLANV